MPCESVERVTQLLRAAQAGDAAAADQLLAVVYEQLHQLARARMGAQGRVVVEANKGALMKLLGLVVPLIESR